MQGEIHVTVEDFPTVKQANEFGEFCRSLGGKPLLIQLAKGNNPLQLMIAYKVKVEDDESLLQAADALAIQIVNAGWHVVRVKTEAKLGTGTNQYFEAHWKWNLHPNDAVKVMQNVMDFAGNGQLHHSRSLFNPRVHWLTARSKGDFADAGEEFDQLQSNMFNLVGRKVWEAMEGVHYERVIQDSNPRLDDGWANI